MAFEFPQFHEPIPINSSSSWTATFDSYDQRNDDCYYLITVREGEHQVSQFMTAVGLWWADDDWSDLKFTDRLREALAIVAATGQSNTNYRGLQGN
ncbi:hypothetical protein TUMEXPCC7403_02040 [Tumidithrix helvetica PCC 7403]|uniref:hypothetical protein n=1 Tax=Tumidithrix helvetica TaxID=3457545 RepID=UPI003C9193B0